ncbi:hypothetical protein BV898_14486 [Hypsibius exemplaris]|uniref:G-protein coupled receptors family 1 profile domain-containing protein n=1 Tax=Hypsibius exemplaris TaxID=2072580 RepID=A0A9X6RJD3_HYPEX|nr:hypothetical protein BV898_14486 [Hypsibius exemplaris]
MNTPPRPTSCRFIEIIGPILVNLCALSVIGNTVILCTVFFIRKKHLTPTLMFSRSGRRWRPCRWDWDFSSNNILLLNFDINIAYRDCIVLVVESFRLATMVCSALHFLMLADVEFAHRFPFRAAVSALFFIPVTLMSVVYVHVFIVLYFHRKELLSLDVTGSNNDEKRRMQSKPKALVTTLIILLTYLIGWLQAFLVDPIIYTARIQEVRMVINYPLPSFKSALHFEILRRSDDRITRRTRLIQRPLSSRHSGRHIDFVEGVRPVRCDGFAFPLTTCPSAVFLLPPKHTVILRVDIVVLHGHGVVQRLTVVLRVCGKRRHRYSPPRG